MASDNLQSSARGCLLHAPPVNRSFVPAPLARAVVYELHIASFTAGGTFGSAIARLPHLAALGVTHIELMPVTAFGGSASGWGYNPLAQRIVMPALGGALGLRRFVDAANRLGMAVVLDIVWNHMQQGNTLSRFDGYAGSAGDG